MDCSEPLGHLIKKKFLKFYIHPKPSLDCSGTPDKKNLKKKLTHPKPSLDRPETLNKKKLQKYFYTDTKPKNLKNIHLKQIFLKKCFTFIQKEKNLTYGGKKSFYRC